MADSGYRPAGKWTYWVGLPAAVLLFALMTLGTMSEMGVVPSTAVISGSELSVENKDLLLDLGVINPGEQIELFYSTGLTSISAEGNLLTDSRIVSYEDFGEGLFVYSAKFDQVDEVMLVQEGDYLSDTIIEVWPANQEGFRLLLSNEEGGDARFIAAMNEKLPTAKQLVVNLSQR